MRFSTPANKGIKLARNKKAWVCGLEHMPKYSTTVPLQALLGISTVHLLLARIFILIHAQHTLLGMTSPPPQHLKNDACRTPYLLVCILPRHLSERDWVSRVDDEIHWH